MKTRDYIRGYKDGLREAVSSKSLTEDYYFSDLYIVEINDYDIEASEYETDLYGKGSPLLRRGFHIFVIANSSEEATSLGEKYAEICRTHYNKRYSVTEVAYPYSETDSFRLKMPSFKQVISGYVNDLKSGLLADPSVLRTDNYV